MTDEIRRAMEARLAALEASPERRARIRARIAQTSKEEEPVVKRRLSVAMSLVLALMLLGGTALAAGLGLNLFEILGEKDERWLSVADKAVLATQVPFTAEHDVLGETVVTITNAYYDGQSLGIAYALENFRGFEPWTPTEEELAELKDFSHISDEAAAEYMEYLMTHEFAEFVTEGEPYGVVEYEYIPNTLITANGVEVSPGGLVGGYQENGTYYEIIDYGVHLPKGVADQEKLEINVPLGSLILYHWYDDGQWHSSGWRTDPEHIRGERVLTATVYRDDGAQVKRFTGTAEYKGGSVTVTADLSITHGTVTVTASNDAFIHIAKGGFGILRHVWNMEMVDDQDRLYKDDGEKPENWRELHFVCPGTGFIPESLTMLLYEYDESDDSQTEEQAKAEGVTITLLPE